MEKHAPIRKRRIQHPTFPQLLKPDIISAMKIRDKLKHEKKSGHYKNTKKHTQKNNNNNNNKQTI